MTPQRTWIRVGPEAPDDTPRAPEVGVVLVRVPQPASEQAGATILALARGWRDDGRRVFLCDACFEAPFLHSAAELGNGEGLSDALLFGTSFQRIAHKLDRDLHLAGAGTVVPDPSAARAHPRWTTILNGFAQAEALLVVAVPETPEVGSPLDLDNAVRLDLGEPASDDEEVISIEALAPGEPTGDLLHAAASEAPETGFGLVEPERGFAGDVEGSAAEPSAAEPLLADPPGEAPALQETDPVPLEPVSSPPIIDGVKRRGRRKSSSSSSRTLLLLLLLVVIGVIAAAWYGFLEIPGITPADADAGLPETVAAAEGAGTGSVEGARSPVAQPIVSTAPSLGWVLSVGAFQDGDVARAQAQRLRVATPGLGVLVVPVDSNGQIFHRVAAGPVEDSAEAAALRSTLGRPQGLAPVDEWVVRDARLAFQLGETGDRASAERRAEVLEGLGISTHLLAVSMSDGSTRYRVYAGAFADAGEAAGLKSLLVERGLANPPLIERIGRRPE